MVAGREKPRTYSFSIETKMTNKDNYFYYGMSAFINFRYESFKPGICEEKAISSLISCNAALCANSSVHRGQWDP